MPRLSPDGRWIAFTTDESGRNEVVVQPFPGPGGRVQVSASGGTEPVWSRDGRRLFYRGDGRLMAATIRSGPAFEVASRDTVLTDTYVFAGNPHANYDVMPDGKHFIFLKGETTGEMIVVSNGVRCRGSRSLASLGMKYRVMSRQAAAYRRSRRISTRGNPPRTDDVSAAL